MFQLVQNLTNTFIKICDSNNVCTLNASKEIDVTITNNTGSTINTDNLNINFTFTPFYTVTYNNLVIGDALEGHNYEYIFAPPLNDVSITMNNSTLIANTDYTYSSGNLAINNVTGDIIITEVTSSGNPWYELCTSTSNNLNCKLITIDTPYADNISSANVSASTGINFSAVSGTSNGRGLYYTADTSKTEDLDGDGSGDRVYYYRGSVDNNFVRLDDYCWRIVRINENGTIRLIYDGTPSGSSCPRSGTNVSIGTSKFNTPFKDNTYVGYKIGTTGASSYNAAHSNASDSSIKGVIDSWYSSNLQDSSAYLADYIFCNDRSLNSGNGYGTAITTYSGYNRFSANTSSQSPTYKCAQDNDKFTVDNTYGNGTLDNPIGVLTADEASYAGMIYSSSGRNNDCFLYSGAIYWLMTPSEYDSSDGAYMYYINNLGQIRVTTAGNTRYSFNTRPVINLSSEALFSSGTGAYNSPYVVSMP